MVNGWQQAALVIMALSGMFLTAKIFSRKRPAAPAPRTASRVVPQFGD
jgi:hypothetical protein